MTPAEFQKVFGARWAEITRDPAFEAAMSLANLNTIEAIGTLSDEHIEHYGKSILADLRGRLSHENELIKLSVPTPTIQPIEEEYAPEEIEPTVVSTSTSGDNSFIASFTVPRQPTVQVDRAEQIRQIRRNNAAKARAAKKKKLAQKKA